jgi:hypothetical protein
MGSQDCTYGRPWAVGWDARMPFPPADLLATLRE